MNHTRYRVRSPENNQAGAKAYEATLRHKLAIGEPLKPTTPKPAVRTFAEFSQEWFETYVKTNNKPTTQALRRNALATHLVPTFGDLALADIDVARVEHYKRTKLAEGLAPSTINLYIGVLAKCLRDAVEWGVLTVVPKVRFLRHPRPTFDFLNHEEADHLVATMKAGALRTMTILALNTGMRIGEICGLSWDDIDLETRQLVVRRTATLGIVGSPKNNRERQIPLSAAAVETLASIPKGHRSRRFVFQRKTGELYPYATARWQLSQACRRAGMREIGWHVLRHTFASWLVADGVPLLVVQTLLGHASIEMTMRYSHLAPSSFRSAIDVLERRTEPTPVGYSWATGGQRALHGAQSPTNQLPSTTPNTSLNC
jgi:integrase